MANIQNHETANSDIDEFVKKIGSAGELRIAAGGTITNDGVQAAHIADPTDLATCITAITAILDALEGVGAVATS